MTIDERAEKIERAFLNGHSNLKTMTMKSFIAAEIRAAVIAYDKSAAEAYDNGFYNGLEEAAKIADSFKHDDENQECCGGEEWIYEKIRARKDAK